MKRAIAAPFVLAAVAIAILFFSAVCAYIIDEPEAFEP